MSATYLSDGSVPEVFPAVVEVVDLSEREAVVLRGISRGGDVPTLARELFVSPNTVKTQLRGVYRKLGVRTRKDAIAVALRKGLL